MTRTATRQNTARLVGALALVLLAAGCGDESDHPTPLNNEGSTTPIGGGGGGGGGGDGGGDATSNGDATQGDVTAGDVTAGDVTSGDATVTNPDARTDNDARTTPDARVGDEAVVLDGGNIFPDVVPGAGDTGFPQDLGGGGIADTGGGLDI